MGFVKDVRLPRHVLPDSYIITLIPYLVEGNYTVDGLVEINARIADAPNSCDNKVMTNIGILRSIFYFYFYFTYIQKIVTH